MADVYVNSWSEFVSAVGSYDNENNKIILPQNAVWDMADIEPYGVNSLYIHCPAIDGRGTCIKNLVLNTSIIFGNNNGLEISNLEMKDWMCSGSTSIFSSFSYKPITMYSCTFSGILASGVQYFFNDGMTLYNCAFNIEASGSAFKLSFGVSNFQYCRLEVHLPNVTQDDPYSFQIFNYQDRCYFCELLLYAPNVISIGSGTFSGCVLRGNMTGVTQDFYAGSQGGIDWEGFVSIYKDDMFSNQFTPIQPLGFVCCTEAQMKNPVYLRGKGFPIVVEDGSDYTTVENDTPPVVEVSG